MSENDCRPLEYEQNLRVRLVKGDNERLKSYCKKKDAITKERDGYLKQGKNRCNIALAIHDAIDCLEKHGLQSSVQKTLE